ncbi:MAG: type II toxin-antitoxin system VapC family toxin [Fibromonadaceae bacterium]|jgi:PIN domain nuclease of toxin-antitoxin system|nr:type II toxin-antitoxin system VapC family toxin [Fibromonadaceae bacterium]
MRYFLDTNILIFHALDNDSLDRNVISILDNYENLIYVSSEVVKETMHLIRQKKIDVKHWKTPNDIWKSISEWGFVVDYVKEEHIKTLGNLATAKDHKDPTDHIIIAQAITNKMPVISSDGQFRHYKGQGLNLFFNNAHERNKIAR